MEEDHKAVIQNNFWKLLEELDPKAIMRYLFEKKVITSENVDTIKSKTSRLSKGDELLHILMRSGPDAFPKFIAGLQETKKPWLALLLLEEEKERLSEKAKQSKELSEEKSEKWSEEKKHLEERIMELETGQSNGDDLKQQMETLTNAFGNCNDLKIQIETPEKEKQDIVERCTNSEEQLKFNEGQWSMREKDYEDQIEELKNQLMHYEDEKKNHSPSPGHGKSTSASGSRESIFRGQKVSRTDIAMDDKSRDILIRAWPILRKDLEPLKLLPDLVDVLDSKDIDEIGGKNSRVDKVDELLRILPRRGQKAFELFKKALQEVQPHLTVYLETETEDMKTQRNQERPTTAVLRKTFEDAKTALEKREREKATKR